MKESKRKTGNPERAYSVPGILRKSLSRGLTNVFPWGPIKYYYVYMQRFKNFKF